MDICFVPSLEQLAGVKIVTGLVGNLNLDVNLPCDRKKREFSKDVNKVKESIAKLTPFNCLRVKLEHFIAPILCEIEKWANIRDQNSIDFKRKSLHKLYSNQHCWLSDGSIDREKSADILLKNSDISPLSKFVISCMFCMFNNALDLWNSLWEIEKAFFRERYFKLISDPYSILRRWVEWLDNSSINKDWESFVAFVHETGLYKNNVYIMKHVLESSSSEVKSHYSVEAFHKKNSSIDIKRFCLMIMSTDERSMIFREYPVDVCKCFLSWPLRCNFMNLMDNLWPHVTPDTFCDILSVILNMINDEEKDYVDLLIILKNFWEISPGHYKKAAKIDKTIYIPLNFVLKYGFEQDFCKLCFEECFDLDNDGSGEMKHFLEFLRNNLNGRQLIIESNV